MKKINYQNIIKNLNYLKDTYKKDIFFVVKNNAYNTGLIDVVNECKNNNLRYFAVCTVTEAITIKKNYPNAYILVMNPLDKEEITLANEYDLVLSITSLDWYKNNYDKIKNLKLHLKINIGMNRFGINNIKDINNIIDNNPNVEGLLTHFAVVEEDDLTTHNKQVEQFLSIYNQINKKDQLKYIHTQNSGTLLLADSRLDICNFARIGILAYGYSPTSKVKELSPSVYLISKIIEIHKVKAHELIGYGFNGRQDKDTLIAVCPIGYGDGLNKLRMNLPVIINNNKYDIIAISMSHMIIKIDNNVKVNDSVEIYGDNIRIDDLLDVCSTTNSIHMASLH